MNHDSRYIVGIDLGTTNCVVSFIDKEQSADQPGTELFRILQVTDAGVAEEKDLLPSFLYLPAETELPRRSLSLPWAEEPGFTVGTFARRRGAEVPLRLVSSSKSWLCYPQIDRTAPLLPWNAPEEVHKVSPLDASSRLLGHIRNAWNYSLAGGRADLLLEKQEVLLTVPASFDAIARELTVRAAESAGIPEPTLLEEPQAAFYAWINRRDQEWRKQAKVGDMILVCDIGGGTTDFSLIEVEDEAGDLALKRVAVGEHILLGGDNMDLTLAWSVRKQFSERKINLDTRQMLGLVYGSREAKERMLNDPRIGALPLVILGRGKSVVGGTLETELKRSHVEETIVEGFFPKCSIGDSPREQQASGFRELGLQYAPDTAITRYLARFLRMHAGKKGAGTFIHPTKLLFNGGVTKALSLRNRIVEVVNSWLAADGGAPVEVLTGTDPDTAVAIGAAYYGFAKKGRGIRIRAGAGRSYYIGIESSMPAVPGMPPPIKALCVVPFGMEEGTDLAIRGHEFGLVVGRQAVFRFLSSTVRKEDTAGAVVEEWDESEIEELPPLETTLRAEGIEPGRLVPVRLHSYLTETGSLELWCEATAGAGRWKLEFNVREQKQLAA